MSYRFISIVVLALTMVSASAAQDDPALPGGDPPHFFTVTGVNKEGLVIKRRPPSSKEVDVPLVVYKPMFKTMRATNAKGKMLTADEVARRVKPGSLILVSADEEPVNSAFLTVIKEDTVILLDVVPRKGATGATVEK